MFKRIKVLIGILVTFIALASGGALSYFIFSHTKDSTFESTATVDNIAENHNFAKPSPKNTFDIYFFPSTYYMYHQMKHYENPNAQGFTMNAEELYGCVNKVFSNGQIKDEIEFVSKTTTINNYHNDYLNLINQLGSNSYCYKGEPGSFTSSAKYDTTGFSDKATDRADTPNSTYDKNNFINYNGNYEFEEPNPFYQRTDQGERLGYWSQYNLNEGRLLPIKFSFTGTFNPEIFEKIISSNPYADMCDKQGWANFKFTNWAYIEKNNNQYLSDYTFPGKGFTNKDLKYAFSSYHDLVDMSELVPNKTNHYVLRLFPVFSNGCDYELGGNSPIYNGARDGLRIDYIYDQGSKNDNTYNDCGIASRYFTYPYVLNNNQNQNVTCAMIENYSINIPQNNLRDLYIRVRKEYTGLFGYPVWRDGWEPLDIYNVDVSKTIVNCVYNFYLFSTVNHYKTETEAINALYNEVKTDTVRDKHFPLLKGKELVEVSDAKSTYKGPLTNNNLVKNVAHDGSNYRAYAIFYEEVIDVKLMDELPVEKTINADGSLSFNAPDPGIEGFAQSNFELADSFYFGDKGLYEATYNKATRRATLKKDASNNFINRGSDSTYIYKVDGFDLSYPEDAIFQFRFSSGYKNNVIFNLSSLPKDTYIYEGSDPNKVEVAPDESNIFTNASEYFTQVEVTTNGKKEYAFIPIESKKKELKGYYNIILDYNGVHNHVINGQSTPCGEFNVYVYRQKNIFVKVIKDYLIDEEAPNGDLVNGILNHKKPNSTYYSNSFYLGTQLSANSILGHYMAKEIVNGTAKDIIEEKVKPTNPNYPYGNNATLRNVFLAYGEERWKETNTNPNIPHDQKKNVFYLVDYSSQRIVGKFEKDANNINHVYLTTDFKIKKNYVLHIVEKDVYFNEFKNTFK